MSLVVATLTVLLTTSSAGASECYPIRDESKRLECLAVERRSPETCTSIRNPDDRALCRQRARQRSL